MIDQIVLHSGDWAGNVWESGGCAASTGVPTCEQYVQDNGSAFNDACACFSSRVLFGALTDADASFADWEVNYVKVYQTS